MRERSTIGGSRSMPHRWPRCHLGEQSRDGGARTERVPELASFAQESDRRAVEQALGTWILQSGRRWNRFPWIACSLGPCTNSRIEICARGPGASWPFMSARKCVPWLCRGRGHQLAASRKGWIAFCGAGFNGANSELDVSGDNRIFCKPGERCASTSNRNF